MGSSAKITRGPVTSARATATRWPWPPETSPGRLAAHVVDLQPLQPLAGRCARPPCAWRRSAAAAGRRSPAQVSSGTSWPNWKTKPNSVRRSALRSASDMRGQLAAAVADRAGVRADDPGEAVQQRRLAGAGGAHDGDDLAGVDGELRAVQRGGRAVGLVQVVGGEQGSRGASCAAPPRASLSSRAAVSSSQRRSASRWNRAWSQMSWSARSPRALALGQLAHQPQVLGALGVEQVGGVAAGEQREDDLGVEGRLEVRLGLLGRARATARRR